jgi:transposase-like protein
MANLLPKSREPEELSEAQETAMAALREGNSFVAAARKAGIGRATLYRWVQWHPEFRAAYNLWQREMVESAQAKLLRLTDKAVEVLEKALERNDEKVALKMLRGTGVLRRRRAGSIEADVLDMQMELQKRRETKKAATGMMHELLRNAGYSRRQRQAIINQGQRDFGKPAVSAVAGNARDGADETLCETEPAEAVPTPSPETAASAAGAGDGAANDPLPPEMRHNPPPAGPRLVDETSEGDAPGVSHDLEGDGESQVMQGWRIGEQLYGTQ